MSVTRSVLPGDDSTLTREPYTGKHLAAIEAAGITHAEVVIADDPKRQLIKVSVIVGQRYAGQPVTRWAREDEAFLAAIVDTLAEQALAEQGMGDTPTRVR
jgi:hypothetical protein